MLPLFCVGRQIAFTRGSLYVRFFNTTSTVAARDVKTLGVVGAGQMVECLEKSLFVESCRG